jgi:hypothetical protein
MLVQKKKGEQIAVSSYQPNDFMIQKKQLGKTPTFPCTKPSLRTQTAPISQHCVAGKWHGCLPALLPYAVIDPTHTRGGGVYHENLKISPSIHS